MHQLNQTHGTGVVPKVARFFQNRGPLVTPAPVLEKPGYMEKPGYSPALREEGMAMLLALFAIIGIAGVAAVVMVNVMNSAQNTSRAVNDAVLDEACKAAFDIGIKKIWHEYVVGNGNTTGNLASYRTFIGNTVGNNEILNGVRKDYNGDGKITTNPPAYLITTDAPRALQSGAQITSLRLDRTDDLTGIGLTFTATAKTGTQTKTDLQTVRVSGAPFAGFQFAILANNINCILCHSDFRNVDMYTKDPATGAMAMKNNAANYGTFDRIKVAALQTLMVRTGTDPGTSDEADTRCAGSIYTRGQIIDTASKTLSASAITNSTLDAYGFSNTNGKMTQNATTGAMPVANLVSATVTNGMPSQFANLYMNYPTDTNLMNDGPLPLNFPAPFPDLNGNRKLDATEFQPYLNTANGSIQGCVAVGVTAGSTYAGTALPAAADSSTLSQLANGSYNGNLILVGTSSAPIQISGQVAVNGDVVITGPIKGYGQLMVSGNAYVVGDVTYADAPGTFGQAADGTTNAFALEAGGNILMGDYLTVRARNNYVSTKTLGTNYTETKDTGVWQGNFVRVDQSTQSVTMGGVTTKVGYFDPGAVDAGGPQADPAITSPITVGGKKYTITPAMGTDGTKNTGEGQDSFTTSELMLFNRLEHQKWAPPGNVDYNASTYIPNYTPRYYQLRPTAPVYEYQVTGSTDPNLYEHVVDYNSPGVKQLSSTSSNSWYMGANASILSLAPNNNWISESVLRQIWYNDEANRRAHPTVTAINGTAVQFSPFRFDGLLYTNNCIFGVMHGNARHGSATYGQLWVRGGLVAADLGILSTDNNHQGSSDPYYGGAEIYYDKRVNAFLNVVDPTQVTFARVAYQHG